MFRRMSVTKSQVKDDTLFLLENDELELWTEENDSGFSSNCDSSLSEGEESINENSISQEFDEDSDREEKYTATEKADETIPDALQMRFKNHEAISWQLQYITSLPELCDVTFHVGPKGVPIHGVKAILGTRSRTMYSLILEHQRRQDCQRKNRKSRAEFCDSRLHINVTKYKVDDFRAVMAYIHSASIDLNIKNVIGVMCAAYQFDLDDLKSACSSYLKQVLKLDVTLGRRLVKISGHYNQHKSYTRVLSKINKYIDSQLMKNARGTTV